SWSCGLEVLQLQIGVARGLGGEDRVVGQLGVPVRAMASGTVFRFLPSDFDLFRRGVDLRDERTWEERHEEGSEDRYPHPAAASRAGSAMWKALLESSLIHRARTRTRCCRA